MASSTNVHLGTERSVVARGKITTREGEYPWHTITIAVDTESTHSEHEMVYFITTKQSATFADALEALARDVRKAADLDALRVQRPPLSTFAQAVIRTVATATQDMMNDVEQRR